MIRAPLSIPTVLDEATEVVTLTAAPWAGLLIATAIPYRFLQALFFDQLFEVGAAAPKYGNLLGGTANLIVVSILVALWGRAVYARACRLAIGRRATPGRETWRVPAAALASYVLTSAAVFFAQYLSVFTCLGVIVAAAFAGLAIGTMELNQRVSLSEPFRLMTRHSRGALLIGMVLVFVCALFVVFFNLAWAFGLVVWAVSAIGGFDAPQWQLLFSGENRRFLLLLLAGAFVAIEPFWIAANVVFVRKAGAEERGDDLRAWFEELRRAS
ncbi:MAG TPA: hypothetical protein VND45_00385 [Thermoanaerobaculia bacterium]|nr:hypothetical protein [Thermoanaerobaculia bacterium]